MSTTELHRDPEPGAGPGQGQPLVSPDPRLAHESGPDPAASMVATEPPATSALMAAVVALVTLLWWSTTDRLDLPKQWVLVAATLAAGLITLLRGRPVAVGPLTLILIVAPLLALVAAPTEGAARVEGWVGWLAAVALMTLARHASRAALGPPLTALALGLAVVAWLQAAGIPLFGGGTAGPGGRGVLGTLGGPNHLGWMLAMLLPWAATTLLAARRWWALAALGLLPVVGALVLTGSRTAWAATLVALPFWLPIGRAQYAFGKVGLSLRRGLWLLLAFLLALGAALAADGLWDRAHLHQRASDLGSPSGTASGRLYLWRVHRSALTDQLGLGGGPESFVRRWPEWQARYLKAHPEDARFRSDLRHAHADPVEVLTELGLPGLLLGIWLLLRILRRRPDEVSPRGPPLGSLVALVVAGFAASPLYFAPTLALAAVCLGLRLGPPPHAATWLGKLLPPLALAVALWPLTQRLRSEVARSEASRHRLAHRPAAALGRARDALGVDDRNPRAWIEAARALERLDRPEEAVVAWSRAAEDLPTDAVRQRLGRLRRRLKRAAAAKAAARRANSPRPGPRDGPPPPGIRGAPPRPGSRPRPTALSKRRATRPTPRARRAAPREDGP